MVYLKSMISMIILLPGIFSCAKTEYLLKQGKGQLALIYKGRPNQEVLENPAVSEQHKDKIRKIMRYKKWFYQFWGIKEGPIYDKTTFLEDKAVSYLVIASPYDEIKAKRESFPFVGSFPYIGHFKKKDALEWAKKLEKEGWVTWTRPVYAYSTLGKLNDRILSSFFYYDDESLSELIFHELFHTLFFVKDEITLNENLAVFFARQMREIYFQKKAPATVRELLSKEITKQAVKLNDKYKKEGSLTHSRAQEILQTFLDKEFRPHINQICRKLKISSCQTARSTWNNARFAAFLTYRGREKHIENLYQKQAMAQEHFSLQTFFAFIQEEYRRYQESEMKKSSSFTNYLLRGGS